MGSVTPENLLTLWGAFGNLCDDVARNECADCEMHRRAVRNALLAWDDHLRREDEAEG